MILSISLSLFFLHYRIKVWDLSQETVVTTYNGETNHETLFFSFRYSNDFIIVHYCVIIVFVLG